MEYFHALLDSYDKLKKRKLKVTLPRINEAEVPTNDPNAEAAAQKAIQLAANGTNDQPADIGQTHTGAPIRGYTAKDGSILVVAPWPKGGMRQKTVIEAGGQVVPDVWQEFVSFFTQEEAPPEGATGTTEEQVLTPEQQLAAERQAAREAEWVEFHEGPGKSFLTVKSHVEEIKAKWENWATTETVDTLRALGGNLRDSDFVLNKFEDYVVGGWGGSLERKIKNAQGVDIVIENGKEVAKLGSVDDDLKEVVSERVEKAFKLLNDGECGVEADGKNWFEKNFRTTEIGGSPALLIRGHGTLGRGDVEGLVVDNKTAGVLQGLIEGQCKDVELESVDFKKTVLGDGKERRGYSFEHILEPIRYQQKCDDYASSKDPPHPPTT